MIEDYYYLVECVVQHYMPDSRVEDLRSVGFLGLIEAYPNRPQENTVTWLVSRIKYAILEYMEADHLIKIPYRSLERHNLEHFKITELLEHDALMIDDSLELAIKDLPIEEEEKEIIKLLVSGYTMAETAEIAKTNAMNIHRRIKIIRKKLSIYYKEEL